MFLRSQSLTIYYTSDFNPSARLTLGDRTIPSLPILDASVFTDVESLTTKNIRSGNRQKQYGDIFDNFLQLATSQIIGTFHLFFDYWKPQELRIPSVELPFDQQKSVVLSFDSDSTIVIYSPSTKHLRRCQV